MRARSALAPLIAAGVISACAHEAPESAMLRHGAAVTPVMTEHSAGLKCLGGLIDQSGVDPVTVLVRDIDDTTVPVLNEERRLSMGGAFILHTALSRLQTSRVQGVLDEARHGARTLTLSGAWTQDDIGVGSGGVGVGVQAGNARIRLGGRNASDFIAGDFISSVNGRVSLSTAIGVALPRRGREGLLIIDDGKNSAEFGFDAQRAQGAQMAQRRVLEAAALVHLAHHFRIDYRPCLEQTATSPSAFLAALDRYEQAGERLKHTMAQEELARLGFLSAPVDGRWGPVSARALASFQASRSLPPTGRPSAVIYALMAGEK
jgi:hypothetical protein